MGLSMVGTVSIEFNESGGCWHDGNIDWSIRFNGRQGGGGQLGQNKSLFTRFRALG